MKKSTALVYLIVVTYVAMYVIYTNDAIFDEVVKEMEYRNDYYKAQLGIYDTN